MEKEQKEMTLLELLIECEYAATDLNELMEGWEYLPNQIRIQILKLIKQEEENCKENAKDN